MVCAAPVACPSEQLAQGDEPDMDDELAAALIAASEKLVGADGLLAVRSSVSMRMAVAIVLPGNLIVIWR